MYFTISVYRSVYVDSLGGKPNEFLFKHHVSTKCFINTVNIKRIVTV